MSEKYISLNIRYLCDKFNLTQNEFGELFGLGRSSVNMYIAERSTPQVKTVIEISKHFEISIDDFLLSDMSKSKIGKSEIATITKTNEPDTPYSNDSCSMCDIYKGMLKDKERIIEVLERENILLRGDEKRKGA